MRNQKNTRDGEYVGLRVGQVQVGLHVVGAMPTKSTKPMAKKQSMTGKSFAKEEFLVFSMLKIIICYFNPSLYTVNEVTLQLPPLA